MVWSFLPTAVQSKIKFVLRIICASFSDSLFLCGANHDKLEDEHVSVLVKGLYVIACFFFFVHGHHVLPDSHLHWFTLSSKILTISYTSSYQLIRYSNFTHICSSLKNIYYSHCFRPAWSHAKSHLLTFIYTILQQPESPILLWHSCPCKYMLYFANIAIACVIFCS